MSDISFKSSRPGRVVVSFDLWNTLLFRSQLFNERRVQVIKQFFKQIAGMDFDENEIYQQIDRIGKIADQFSKVSVQINPDDMYAMLIYNLLKDKIDDNAVRNIVDRNTQGLKADIDDIFLYKQHDIFPNYVSVCEEITVLNCSYTEIQFAVISNTGWMDENVMKQKIEKDYPDFFRHIDLWIFSGKEHAPKPNTYTFRQVQKELKPVRWFHIGDDEYCDGAVPGTFLDVTNSDVIKTLQMVESILKSIN